MTKQELLDNSADRLKALCGCGAPDCKGRTQHREGFVEGWRAAIEAVKKNWPGIEDELEGFNEVDIRD